MLSPVGLILSLVALGREPRGFAIAGAIIGALGTCFICVATAIAIAVPALFIAIIAALGIAGVMGPGFVDKVEMARIAGTVEEFRADHGFLPMSLKELTFGGDADDLTDRWGHPYVYELAPNGMSFRLFSVGPDGLAGTADDIVANPEWVLRLDLPEEDALDPGAPSPAPDAKGTEPPPANPAESR
jgi:hypothetical protein